VVRVLCCVFRGRGFRDGGEEVPLCAHTKASSYAAAAAAAAVT
jgi:hypothetical protein